MDASRPADDQVSADDLWWSWAVVAASADVPEDLALALDEDEHLLSLDHRGGWLRMQRLRGGRALLWGRTSEGPVPLHAGPSDLLAGLPDWARSDAVRRSCDEQPPEFVAWYAHGEWDTNTTDRWDDSLPLFDVMRTAPRELVRAARNGETDDPLLVAARGAAPLTSQQSMRHRIATQIYDQMRDACEADRGLPDRPTLLVQWLRIAQPSYAFQHVVRVEEGIVSTVHTVPRLTAETTRRLTGVLQQVYRNEAAEDAGAWLLARVVFDGARITLERAFDSLPGWFKADPPSLGALTWEMRQRTQRWRPAWASLLPERP
jgi:hypothetical protein